MPASRFIFFVCQIMLNNIMLLKNFLRLHNIYFPIQTALRIAFNLILVVLVVFPILAFLTTILSNMSTVFAQDIRVVVRGSGYDVPRFLSLKSDKAYMRFGPGNEYPIAWVYQQKGLPLKVIAEYEVWRKVVDHDGITGWMHAKLLTGRRTALVTERVAKLYKSNEDNSKIVGYAERNVLMELQYCRTQYCKVAHPELKGWIKRDSFWGLLENEVLN